jgi:hypothetical protein
VSTPRINLDVFEEAGVPVPVRNAMGVFQATFAHLLPDVRGDFYVMPGYESPVDEPQRWRLCVELLDEPFGSNQRFACLGVREDEVESLRMDCVIRLDTRLLVELLKHNTRKVA